MGRITSIETLDGFNNKYTLDARIDRQNINGNLIQAITPRALSGYKPPSLPPGTKLLTDAPFVVIIGKNGSGKSTLIDNLGLLLIFPELQDLPEMFNNSYSDGVAPKMILCRVPEQAFQGNVFSCKGEVDSQDEKESRMSMGQYQAKVLGEYMDNIKGRESNFLFALDQPENNLGPVERAVWAHRFCSFMKDNPNQMFVATNGTEFLSVAREIGVDTVVINLYDSPARSYRIGEFDLKPYIRAELESRGCGVQK